MSYYDIPARFVPIERWPGEPTRRRERSRFRASWGMTLDLLKTELRHLGAKNVLIEIDMPERMIRLDGYPRADARANGPGIILSFESKHGPLRYAVDRFTTWEDTAPWRICASHGSRRLWLGLDAQIDQAHGPKFARGDSGRNSRTGQPGTTAGCGLTPDTGAGGKEIRPHTRN